MQGNNVNKATGYDGIPPRVIKASADGYASLLVPTLIDHCLGTSQIPEQWKLGEIIPSYKKESALNKANYRQITVLSCLSKIFERSFKLFIID
jgi:hypothetical protein